MPLGNPNFIDLDPRIVAEDRERFRQARLASALPDIGQLVLDAVTLSTEEGSPDEEVDYFKVDPVLVAGLVKPAIFHVY